MAKIFKINKYHYLLLLIVVFVIYSAKLSVTPVHLNQDEMMFALNANSIAKHLTDFYGNRLPFYFWHLDNFWSTPIITYLAALLLKFVPISEATIRLTSVIVGVTSIGIIMLLAERVFKSKLYGLIAGFLLAITPAFFINSRILLDNIYTVPFVLLWLLFLKFYFDKKNYLFLFLSSLSLGVGFHSYHAAKVMMPIYFALMVVILFFKEKVKPWRFWVGLFAGFLIPILLFLPWLKSHPDTLLSQVYYARSIDTSVNVKEGFWGVFNPGRIKIFAQNYVSYFDPALLFVKGDKTLIHSTGEVGVFTFPFVFFIAFGVLEIIYAQKDIFSKIVLFGFLTYPIAPSLINDTGRISRGLVLIPFGILVCLYGVKFLLAQKNRVFRTLFWALLFFSVLQFGLFMKDYFGPYRERSYSVFNNAIGGALESALRSTKIRPVTQIYIDDKIPFAKYYMTFYEEKLGIDVSDKLNYFNPDETDFTKFAQGTLVVVKFDDAGKKEDNKGPFEKIETIREPNGYETFYVYFRD